MLFKNLVFSALLAGKVLASPLHIVIDIEEELRDVTSFHSLEDKHPYEDVIDGLNKQTEVVELLTNSVLTLDETGSTGLETAVLNLRSYSKGLFTQSKSLPKDPFGEGETSFIEEAFKNTTESMVVLAESVYGYNDTIKALDWEGKFAQKYGDARSAFGVYYSALLKLLYKCDKEEKLNGCTGATPFIREYTQVMDITKTAMKSIGTGKKSLYNQVDL